MMSSKQPLKTKILNQSGLHPKGRAVLVEPVINELKTDKIILPETAKERSMMVESQARVIEVGPQAWADEKVPRALAGELVMISRWCGHICYGTKDQKMYRMVNCEDIFCGIEE